VRVILNNLPTEQHTSTYLVLCIIHLCY